MQRTLLALPLAALALLLAAPALPAQDTAQIQGTITDSSGAALAGVSVTATNTLTGTSRNVTTGTDGRFVLPALALGTYSLRYAKAGFSTTDVTGLVLQIGAEIDRHDALK
ncbi:MAG: carboxypeptidase-like regulatory domain-containing protein, partial [Terriglobales bacterium]